MAADVPPVEPYARAWRARLARERAAWSAAAEGARVAARQCAETLGRDFDVRRVYLFGSLAGRGSGVFGPRSDIDLAVEGLPASRYLEAVDTLLSQLPGDLELDLVPIENAQPSMRQRILREGGLLFDRG